MMLTDRYNAGVAEAHWQTVWEERQTFQASNQDPRPKYYVLEMFPYPSGRIHMGHVRNYAMGDVVARYRRAKGFNVIHPMGWDAFGLPAENAAMQNKRHPAEWTYANIAAMRAQLKRMGLSIDWSREIATCDPNYYKQQQRIFLDLLDAGLVDRKRSKVNWDPVDNTVLANEQVIDGRGWRSGAVVEQRDLVQWFLKITDYAQELLDGLDTLDQWPEKVRLMQRNWIGRSEGLTIRWQLDPATVPGSETTLDAYTTRPDTLFGASFLAVAPDHPLAQAAAGKDSRSGGFHRGLPTSRHGRRNLGDCREEGVTTPGSGPCHPFRLRAGIFRSTSRTSSSWTTGRVLSSAARPMINAIWTSLAARACRSCRSSVRPEWSAASFAIGDTAFAEDGRMINSRFLDGLTVPEAKDEVARRLESVSLDGAPQAKRQVNFKLRDWGISRQRYWGCPIPVIHCAACGTVPVPVEDLPVRLPEDVEFDAPGNLLDRHPTWSRVPCPRCGADARRETDTMDTFVDSSWYFARFTDPWNQESPTTVPFRRRQPGDGG